MRAPSHVLGGAVSDGGAQPDRPSQMRRVVRVLSAVVLLLLLVAVGLNWLALRNKAYQFAWKPTPTVSTEYVPSLDFEPKQSAVEMLPGDVIAFETIARHEVPGAGPRAAEAVYATLNMNVEIVCPISLYARVELFNSSADAASALESRMTSFPLRPEQLQVGTHVAQAAYSADEGAWAVGWLEGQSYTFVKAAFKNTIPADKRDFLRDLGRPLTQEIEKYQRTGEEGLSF
jgi:hypothetical protein